MRFVFYVAGLASGESFPGDSVGITSCSYTLYGVHLQFQSRVSIRSRHLTWMVVYICIHYAYTALVCQPSTVGAMEKQVCRNPPPDNILIVFNTRHQTCIINKLVFVVCGSQFIHFTGAVGLVSIAANRTGWGNLKCTIVTPLVFALESMQ